MKRIWEVYYYPKPDETHPVKEYINTLGKREKAKILSFIELLQDNGPNLKNIRQQYRNRKSGWQ